MRLIDADMCVAKIKDMPVTYDSETVQRCIEVVSNAPTIDAEHGELIRCMDCKHHGEQYGNGYCMKDGCYGWCDEDYCSRAERKPPQVNPEMVREMKERLEKYKND